MIRSLINTALDAICLQRITYTLLAVIIFSHSASAQQNGTNDNNVDASNIDRTISVDRAISDKAIEKRLTNILTSAEKYQDISVASNNGIVTMEGLSVNNEFVSWAGNIAKKIEGVVGVINNISAKEVNYFSYQPAKKELLKLANIAMAKLPLIVIGLLVLLLFALPSKTLALWLSKPIHYISDSELIRIVIRRLLTLILILTGFYFFLKIAGLTQFALAIISGTGIAGLILGFAFRDIAENFIASLLISAQRPFKLGDVIETSGHKGIVRKVTARGTTLIDYDGNHIQIPNITIYKNVIKNLTANPHQRGEFLIGIGYDTNIDFAQKIAKELIGKSPAVLNEPEPQILVENLGSSTVNLVIYFWIDSHRHSKQKVGSMLMKQLVNTFTEHNISMPDDAREIVFPEGVPILNSTTLTSTEKTSPSKKHTLNDSPIDDLESDDYDLRKQADAARDPEEGENII